MNEKLLMETQDKSVPWWAWHRRLYNWVLSLAHSKHSVTALFFLSVLESCIVPIAPDVLMIALILEKRKHVWFYAIITTIGSVIGGMIAYAIGATLWEFVAPFFLTHVFSVKTFNEVEKLYLDWGFWAVFIAAFTPIPYKVFTIAAGVFRIPFFMFVLASLFGRAGRFFLVAALLWAYGPPVKRFIDKYFNLLTLVFVVLLVGGFFILKHL
jgi:membrane protein YqaA with SNARE-associated domain